MSSDDAVSKSEDSQSESPDPAPMVAATSVPTPDEPRAVDDSPPESQLHQPESAETAQLAEEVADTTTSEAASATDAAAPEKEGDSTPAETTDETPADEPRRRLRLSPSVDESATKAVPSLAPTAALTDNVIVAAAQAATPAEAKASDEPGAETTDSQPPAASPEDSTPSSETTSATTSQHEQTLAPVANVELPDSENLNAQMEAEIEAAMASGDLDSTPAPAADESAETTDEPVTEETLEPGSRLTGKIQSVHGDDVFLDLGFRSPGVIPFRQFEAGKKPEVGQVIAVVVDRVNQDEGLIQASLPKGMRRIRGNWESVEAGQIVDCMVTKTNKGGLEVNIGSLRGFLPAGHVDLMYVSDLEPYVGQKLRVQIVEANAKKRSLVVSRRAYLQAERKEAQEELWKTLDVGQTLDGTVKTIKNYGVFVDIGGVDGFLHIGEISWTRLNHPSDILNEGQSVAVKVIGLDSEKKKISLGMKQLVPDPWLSVVDKYPTGRSVSGRVTRTADFGAFVELEPGMEGLIHISELEHQRVNRVTDVVNVGQQVDAQVLDVDPARKRVSLSLKALIEKPEAAKASEPEETPAYQRKRTEPLRGGTGTSDGGGLFGNPKEFG